MKAEWNRFYKWLRYQIVLNWSPTLITWIWTELMVGAIDRLTRFALHSIIVWRFASTDTSADHLNLFSNRAQAKKKRKSRTAFTNHQIFELEKRFLYQKYLSPADRDEIAQTLGLTNAQVITWYVLSSRHRHLETRPMLAHKSQFHFRFLFWFKIIRIFLFIRNRISSPMSVHTFFLVSHLTVLYFL